MKSVAHEHRKALEARGDFVALANIASGWFAVFLSTWRRRSEAARSAGREGPDLIVYRTRSSDPRDHHVVPYAVVRPLLTEATITHSAVNGSKRWNLTLKDGALRVTHRAGAVDVSSYHGAPLLVEGPAFTIPDEVTPEEALHEGAARRVLLNAYERDPVARQRCIEHYGRSCTVCGMSFLDRYGPAAADIVHVHHLVALSTVRREYRVHPIQDLRPVCPNCHAVIHSRRPPYRIEEVAALLHQVRSRE